MNIAGFALAPAAVAAAAGTALAQGQGYVHHYGPMGGWLGGLVMVLLFVGLTVGAVWVALRLFGRTGPERSSGRALDILDERFARGEIDRAEHEERRRALKDGDVR